MSQTLQRQWMMLKYIPRLPDKVDAARIKAHLDENGYYISKRSIERDLKAISEDGIFPIEKDGRNKPYGWYWPKNCKPIDIPGMDSLTALSYVLIEQHIRDILPVSIAAGLDPYFSHARAVLKGGSGASKLSYLPEKIRLLDRGPMRKPPEVAGEITEAVHQALLHGQKISVKYLPSAKDEHESYEINPLGLVFKGRVPYLVCTLLGQSDIKQLPLHRFSQANLLSEKLVIPDGFNLDEYINRGEFSYLLGDKQIRFKAIISDYLVRHLSEEPLSEDQKIVRGKDGRYTLSASIEDSHELRWWILSFGSSIEVEKPESLRKEISETANDMCKLYKG